MALSKTSIFLRSLLAVGFLVFLYVFSIVLALVLFLIPLAELKYAHRIHFQVALFCIGGALIILTSILPRREKFTAPGLKLTAEEHPRLFEAIRKVSEAVGENAPAQVYLVPDMNAWVSQYGGFMGIKGKRIMGIGLPLLHVMNVSQLKAVLTHEFGHFYGGDTKVGPWIYATRASLGRILAGLGSQRSWLQWLYIWYGNMFLAITNSVSRYQEYKADQLAAEFTGKDPLISGLRALKDHAGPYTGYLTGEYDPVFRSGYRPPLMEGFQTYLTAPAVQDKIKAQSGQKEPKQSKYDTHPTLTDRARAVEKYPAVVGDYDRSPALTLLDTSRDLEASVLSVVANSKKLKTLEPVSWDQVAEKVYVPMWRAILARYDLALKHAPLKELPAMTKKLGQFAIQLNKCAGGRLTSDQVSYLAISTVGASVALLLLKKGWKLSFGLGQEVEFTKAEKKMRPFRLMIDLSNGTMSRQDWERFIEEENISAVHCGDVAAEEGRPKDNTVKPSGDSLICPQCKRVYDKTWKVCVQCDMPLETANK